MANSTPKKLPKPNKNEVKKYNDMWNNNEEYLNYKEQETAIKDIWRKYPNNTDFTAILLKVIVLNQLYSTNIFGTYQMAKRIQGLKNIDNRLKKGDTNLVAEIAQLTISDKEKIFYSFATKYCSHHNEKDFPIYDSFVDKVLRHFRNVDKFAQFKNDELKKYPKYKEVLQKFAKFYQLEEFSFKQLDKYLWLLGKEYFPK